MNDDLRIVELIARIDELSYEETSAGWLKAASVDELRRYGHGEGQEVIDRHLVDSKCPDHDQEVLKVFLGSWLISCIPDDCGVACYWDHNPTPINRDEAYSIVSEIVEVSLRNPEATIGLRRNNGRKFLDNSAGVTYSDLFEYFKELVAHEDARFYLYDPNDGEEDWEGRHPHVVGLTPRVVAMFWI